jgi:4a-hydroxytetrahydrobiopterin dehydratase
MNRLFFRVLIFSAPSRRAIIPRRSDLDLHEASSDAQIMDALKNEKCTACRRDSPLVTGAEMLELKPLIPEWTLVERDGIQRLERVFRFSNFAEALNFTNRVGAIAEEEGHHPAILTEWGRVTVTLWTHKIRGLHRNDFIMAAKLDAL